MLDLRSSKHHLKIRIVHADGSPVDVGDEEPVAPINFIAATLFETVHMYINQFLVTPSGGQNNPYRAIIEALLDRSRFEKDTIMGASLYKKDEAFKMHDPGSSGFQWRWALMTGSRPCDVTAPLLVDLAEQERLLLNGLEVGFKFFPARPEFTLLSHVEGADYRIQILDAFLRVKTLIPSLLLAVESTLSLSPALYPVMRTEVRRFLIHSGQHGFTLEDVFQSQVPSILVMGLVKERGASRNFQLNPFCWEHGFLSEIHVTVDDRPCGQTVMKFHYDGDSYLKSSYLDGYESLFLKDTTELEEDSASFCDITRRDYVGGYALLKFRFSTTKSREPAYQCHVQQTRGGESQFGSLRQISHSHNPR